MNKKLVAVLAFAGTYLLVTVVSYFAFGLLGNSSATIGPETNDSIKPKPEIDLAAPKTEACPINGLKYSVGEKQSWEKRRPIAAMIENHEDARPLSGLSRADVIYEAVAEGGITRHLAIYYCAAQAADITLAPIRSARIYFVKLAQEYGDRPIYVHVGGANNDGNQTSALARAREYLETIGWRAPKQNDFDSAYDIAFPVLTQNPDRLGREVAVEHRMTAKTEKIWGEAVKRGFTNVTPDGTPWDKTFRSWQFRDDAVADQRGSLADISFAFWDGKYQLPYNVAWTYDKQANSFARTNGGVEQIDHENKERITAKNVIVQFVQEKGPLDSLKHMWYGVEGTGKAIVFQDGYATNAFWTKQGATGRTIYTDSKTGKEIPFVRGRIWIEIVPIGNKVDY
ncbi:MAG: hypothetical protein UW69_C0014G0014 [Microgenomates group bacterium GW2011_GWA2_44_7]|nr:MAG: hypothetical protein UW69_C0014G0014 [Microgenomates group bacterium GW2011_GWA2_44_7]KKT78190.1 MAG: hypothetical protein UW73_C0005G0015 [Microgenomates group bacterium GW2011_GWB1_44_8]